MIYLDKNKACAIAVYLAVNAWVYLRGIEGQFDVSALVLGAFLIPILMPGLVAWFGSWGFIESLAKDSSAGLSPSVVSFLGWLLLIMASAFFLFNMSVY